MRKVQFNKIVLSLLTFVLVLCSSVPVFASESFSNSPYYFTAYDVHINVLEDNTLEITEKIDAHFNESRHGIFRTIPLYNSVQRADGTETVIRAKIKDINVSENFDVDKGLQQCSIQIGDEDTVITGDHSYTISYSYILGEDKNVGFDELYYNIIGDQWDTYIQNVTFSITMPKEFDSSKVGFSSGRYGTVGTNHINFNVEQNVISGSFEDTLAPYSALTMRVELPDEYFYFNKPLYYAKISMLVVIPVIAFVIVLLLWIRHGRDKKIVEVVEFYPPENMSSADVAYWQNGAVTNKDLVPLLIELANEGYLEINEIESKNRFRQSDFEIKRLKDAYVGDDQYKRIFFDGLFNHSSRKLVYLEHLKESFYTTLDKICEKYNSSENRTKVFNEKSLYLRLLGWLISIVSVVAVVLFSATLLGGTEKIICTFAGVVIGIISFVFSFFVRQRTDDGHRILQKIEGFKLFLETAEKERLETLVEENPKYFYDVLPYAYVLGVSDKWVSKFEKIAIEPVQWYSSYHPYNHILFYHFVNDTIHRSTDAIVSAAANNASGGGFSSGGGGFSSGGGGFSGGGVGGGGGGSW